MIPEFTHTGTSDHTLAGHLLPNWAKDSWILNCVQGYRIPLIDIPPRPLVISSSPIQNPKGVANEILKFLLKGVIIPLPDHCPLMFLSPIFMILKKNRDLRLILNLKCLNLFIPKIHFKMEA